MKTHNGGAACSSAPAFPNILRPAHGTTDAPSVPQVPAPARARRGLPDPLRLLVETVGLSAALGMPLVLMLAGQRAGLAVAHLLGMPS